MKNIELLIIISFLIILILVEMYFHALEIKRLNKALIDLNNLDAEAASAESLSPRDEILLRHKPEVPVSCHQCIYLHGGAIVCAIYPDGKLNCPDKEELIELRDFSLFRLLSFIDIIGTWIGRNSKYRYKLIASFDEFKNYPITSFSSLCQILDLPIESLVEASRIFLEAQETIFTWEQPLFLFADFEPQKMTVKCSLRDYSEPFSFFSANAISEVDELIWDLKDWNLARLLNECLELRRGKENIITSDHQELSRRKEFCNFPLFNILSFLANVTTWSEKSTKCKLLIHFNSRYRNILIEISDERISEKFFNLKGEQLVEVSQILHRCKELVLSWQEPLNFFCYFESQNMTIKYSLEDFSEDFYSSQLTEQSNYLTWDLRNVDVYQLLLECYKMKNS
jgi:hypothetical protein